MNRKKREESNKACPCGQRKGISGNGIMIEENGDSHSYEQYVLPTFKRIGGTNEPPPVRLGTSVN